MHENDNELALSTGDAPTFQGVQCSIRPRTSSAVVIASLLGEMDGRIGIGMVGAVCLVDFRRNDDRQTERRPSFGQSARTMKA